MASDNESLRSRSYVRVVDLISEGEIEGLVDGKKSVYLNETVLQNPDGSDNFAGVTVVEKKGTNNQLAVNFIPAVENEVSVETEVKKGSPGPIIRTITDSDMTGVRIRIRVPVLYKIQSDGDIKGNSARIKIYVQSNGGGYVEKIDNTIEGKASNGYDRDYEVELTGSAPWDIKVERMSDDETDTGKQNKTIWKSYTEIIHRKLRYPNSALLALRFDSENFSGSPRRAYDVKLLKVKVPSNYNTTTRAYSGVWDGTFKVAKEWTDNPAWCFYDLLTNTRYGLGANLPESQIDKWALYQVAQYCDELVDDGEGGQEPRFTCNLYIQSRREAYKVIQDMASIFRGMVYWSSGALSVSQDAPADPVALYNAANVVEGFFNYSGTASKARHSVALVTWNDPEDFYRQKVEYIEDAAAIARFGVVETEITAVGCTSRGQANRVGRWLLYSEQYETETVTFRTGLEGCVARPGHVIKVQDPTRAGARLGGRVSSSTTTQVTVDADFVLPASSTLYAMLPDGSVESRTISSKNNRILILSSALSSAPQAGAVWMVSAPSVDVQTFRVISMSEAGDGQVEITALKHDPAKYDAVENGLKLQARDYTQITLRPDAPASLTSSEALYRYQAEVRAKISVSWPKVGNATRYRVRWRADLNNWSQGETSANDYEILDITPGDYDLEVYSIGPTGLISPTAVTGTITALGKTAPPSDVTGFGYVIDASIGATLVWSAVSDLDVDSYEIREGSTWATATTVAKIKGTTLKIGLLPASTKTYLIKALDTSGIYSATAASTSVTVSAPAAPTVTSSFVAENYVLAWNAVAGTLATDSYIIRQGASFASGTTVGTIRGTSFSGQASWTGARTFWVAAQDVAGTIGTAASVTVTVSLAAAPTISATFAGENLVLTWGNVQGSIPTVEYEIRFGSTFASATSLGKIKGTSYQTRASWSGSRTFWVVAIDALDNAGTPGTVAADVVAPAAPTPSATFSGENAVISWNAIAGTMPTDFYEIRFGASFAAGTSLGTIKGTSFTTKASWSGARTFWVAAVDINGTTGAAGSVTSTVTVPVSVTMTQEVIDNNVLLKWGDATASLPIDAYEIRRGSTWAGATVIGRISSRFSVIFESTSGTFTYWVAGVDVAGNYGTPSSVVALVNQPPDYALQFNQDSAFGGTATNFVLDEAGEYLTPVSPTETWQSHFTSRGWTTLQNQVSAGFPIYAMPSQTSGAYEETIDYGTVLAATRIQATLSYQVVSGSVAITPTISVKKLVGDPWTNYAGLSSVYVTDFRYVKVRFDFASSGGDDLITVTGLNVRFDVKLKNDAGTVAAFPSQSGTYSQTGTTITVTSTAHGRSVGQAVDLDFTSGTATDGIYVITSVAANTFTVTSATSTTTSGNVTIDATGTPQMFNVNFVDVQSITVTPQATAARIAVSNFVDTPNPTNFKVLLFDTAGNRVSGSVGWSVKGV